MVERVAPTGAGGSHWQSIARQWSLVGSPLRPGALDAAIYAGVVKEWSSAHGAPRVLLLGVTPEIYRLPWPAGTDLLAVDRNPGMIAEVWPGPPDAVLQADWRSVPLPDASRDLAFLDGGLHLLSWPDGQRDLASELGRLLADGGLLITRLFVPPAKREDPEQVIGDLMAGRIRDLNILKLRLAMAMQRADGEGVCLGLVWRRLHAEAPDLAALARRIGWDEEHLLAINSYRDSAEEYCFVSVEQAADVFRREAGLQLVSVAHPAIELGERCPILTLRKGSS